MGLNSLVRVRTAAQRKLLFLPHALRQMLRPDRMIRREDVRHVIAGGEVTGPGDAGALRCLMYLALLKGLLPSETLRLVTLKPNGNSAGAIKLGLAPDGDRPAGGRWRAGILLMGDEAAPEADLIGRLALLIPERGFRFADLRRQTLDILAVVGGVGLQLVGRQFDEATLLRLGQAYAAVSPFRDHRPPLAD